MSNPTTLQQLIAALQAAMYQQSGVWYIDLDAALMPAAGDLVGYLDKTELTIANAVLTPHVSDVTITGTAVLLDSGQYDVTLVGTVVDNAVRFLMPATPVSLSGWTFTGNFSSTFPNYITSGRPGQASVASFFYALALSSPRFVDATYDDESLGVTRGLTFSAAWNALTQPFLTYTASIPGAGAFALTGTVVPRTSTFPLVDLRADVDQTYDLGGAALTGMYTRLRTAEHVPEASPGEGESLISLGGSVNVGVYELVTEAAMLRGNFVWSFDSLPGQRLPLTGLDALVPYFGIGNPLLLPPGLLFVSQWDLSAISFGVDPGGTSVQFLGGTVSTREPWVTPVPKVTINEIHASWMFDLLVPGPHGYQIGVGGTLAVGDPPVVLFAEADFPEFTIEAGLVEGETISVTNAIRYFTGVTIPLDLLVTRLLFSAYTDAQEYTFEAEVTGTFDYPVAGITYGLINVTIFYTPNSLSAVLSIDVTIGGQNFGVRARTPIADEGWTFSGGLLPGSVFSLADFVQNLFGWSVPDSVAGITVETLWLSFNTKIGDYVFHTRVVWRYQILDYPFELAAELEIARISDVYRGFVKGSFKILDLQVAAAYYFQPSSTTIVFEITYKRFTLQASFLTVTDKQGKTTNTLQVRFPDVTVGEILEWLVSLAAPDLDFSLSAPWSILNQINLKNLVLRVNLDTNAVTLLYLVNVDLGFMSLDSIGMTYDSTGGEPGVRLELSGKLLGQEYSAAKGNPLEWDVINEKAPEVPAKGPKLIDIEYLGFGQRVAFADTSQLNSVTDVINALKAQLTPPRNYTSNPLAAPNQSKMRFDRASHVLIGASFTILETVSLGVVFNDPYLYGVALSLAGERAGSLAGLKFELLYKRISDNVGVFKVELRVPEAFRQFEFGSVSITLPVIKLDIYTNGNFKVDLGFPHGGDFGDSFTVQVFPFIGSGGFYFAYLNGETSERVPRIVNGVFNPVIEAGLGLRVGLGKEIEKGPLSGGISITIQGIVEGIVAWYTPYDNAAGDAKYYWIQGTIALVGKVYGKVDFVVIKVSVSVEARLSTTLTVEAYEPIVVKVQVTVEAKATVTILFIDVNFSFELDLEETFVIGQKTTPPWVLAAGGGGGGSSTLALSVPGSAQQPRLRMQRSHYRARSRRGEMLTRLFSTEQSAMRAQAVTGNAVSSEAWPPVLVFSAIQNVPLTLVPALTVATPPNSPAVVRSEIVLLLFAENSIAPGSIEHADVQRVSVEHSARAADAAAMPFNLLVQAMLRWAIFAVRGSLTGNVTYGDLALAFAELQNHDSSGATFAYENLSDFLGANFVFQVSGVPQNAGQAAPISSTVFPMFPEVSYSAPDVPPVDFWTWNRVTPQYELNVAAYYEQLDVNYLVDHATDPFAPRPTQPSPPSGPDESLSESISTMIFREYFQIIARAAVQAGLDVLGKYAYTLQPGDSLTGIANQFPPVPSTYTARAGDTPPLVAEMFEMTQAEFETANPSVVWTEPLAAGQVVNVRIAVTPQTIASANQQVPLDTGAALTLTNVLYQVHDGDSLNAIATRFGITSIASVVAAPANALNRQLLRRVRELTVAQQSANYQWFAYTSAPGDDLGLIAAWAYVRAEGEIATIVSPTRPPASPLPSPAIDTPADPYSWYVQAILDFNDIAASPGEDLSAIIPTGTPLLVPAALYDSDLGNAITYISRRGDTIAFVAATFETLQNDPSRLASIESGLQSLNPGLPWNALPVGTTVKMPPVGRVVQGNDTFASIALLFNVAITDLAGANAASVTALAPLAVFTVPSVTYAVAAGDTIAKIAAGFNLTIADFANDVAAVNGLFAWPQPEPLTIPAVPAYGVDALCAAVVEQQTNDAAAMVSRFLLDGLQLPDPNDGGFLAMDADALRAADETPVDLEALYFLTGQQIPLPDALPYDITFFSSGSPSWIEFTDSLIVVEEGADALRFARPGIEAMNPAVDFSALSVGGVRPQPHLTPLRPGLLLFAPAADPSSLVITITQEFVDANQASTTFDPEIIYGPRALPLFDLNEARYELPQAIQWQSPQTPPYGNVPLGNAPAAGEPVLWMFTDQLLQKAGALVSPAVWSLFTKTGRDTGGDVIAPVTHYDWATLIPISVSQVVSSVSGEALPNTYVFGGAAQSSRDAMRGLFTLLGDSTAATIQVLWAPNADSNNNNGVASSVLDPSNTFVLKTNLTTLTASGNLFARNALAAGADDDAFYAATIAQPGRFLELLWEGSVTNSGGFTLHYAAADGAGLPGELFSVTPETQLYLLVILDSQSAPSGADRHIYAFNNCAVVGDNVDPSTQAVFVEADSPSATQLIKTASVPPGNVGFELARQNPSYNVPSPVTPDDRTEQLYSLLGFQILPGGGFAASNAGLPVAPGETPASAAVPGWSPNTLWYYRQVFNAATLAASTLPLCPGLPLPANDPYAGIAPHARLTVSFAFHDIYGNDILPETPVPGLPVDVGYTDVVNGIAQWPAIDATYAIAGTAAAPQLGVSLALRLSTYIPGEGNGYANALLAASAAAVRVERSYYQLLQNDVEAGLTTSLQQAAGAEPFFYDLGATGKANLGNFLAGSSVFLGAVQQQQEATLPVSGGSTFLSLATALASSGSPSDQAVIDANVLAFGSANKAVPASSLFATILMPVFHTTAAGDTLASIAKIGSPSLTVDELAQQNATLPLNAGFTIAAPQRQSAPTADNASFASIAQALFCSIGTIATMNANRTSILREGTPLKYSDRVVVVTWVSGGSPVADSPDTDTISLAEVCERFRNQGVSPTPADVAVANQDLHGVFWTGTVLTVADYILQDGDTFDSLQTLFPIDALATAAQLSPNIYPAGLPLYLYENPPLVPRQGDTLETIANTQGIGLDQLTVFNERNPIVAASVILPSRVTLDVAAAASLAPYTVRAGDSLNAIAAAFGETASALAARNWQLTYVFNPGQTVQAGGNSATTNASDSMASLYARMSPAQPTLDAYVTAIAQPATLFRGGAVFVEPLPSTGNATATLSALAQQTGSTPALLAKANAALDGFIREDATVVVQGEPMTAGAHETFDSLVARYRLVYAIDTSVADLATANAGVSLIAASQRFLVPPNPLVLSTPLNLPTPAVYPGNPFRLVTELVIRRDEDCVDPDFADTPSVRQSRSTIAPYAIPQAGGGPDLSLRPFALQFEGVLPSLKVAVGGGEETSRTGPRDLWCIDFGSTGISSVAIASASPSYFGIRPLSTTTRDKNGVPIAPFDPATGTLGAPESVDFQAVDLDVWAGIFVAGVDLLLTSEYAAPAYLQNPAAFESVVAQKQTLAQQISEGLENILAAPSPAGVLADAQERLRQELLINLAGGFSTDAILQYPVQVTSQYKSPAYTAADAPRIAGKPTAIVWITGAADTIGTIATAYGVNPAWIAQLLGSVVRILAAGTQITFKGTPYTLSGVETIDILYVRVGATSWNDFVQNLQAPNGFFVPYTTINIFPASAALAAMTTDPSTIAFDTMIEYYGEPLSVIVANNEQRPAIFVNGITITVSTGSVVVTPANNSIDGIAAAVSLSPLQLASELEATTGILSPTFVAVVAGFLPEHNLSSAKASMWNGASTMNVLFNVKSDASRSHLFLELDYRMNEFEYDIRTLADTGGYQASSWLSFLIPIGADDAQQQPIDSSLGQPDIPIPLRAYPAAPQLLGQTGVAAVTGSPATVETAKQWNYAFSYAYADAAQDALYVQVAFNVPPPTAPRALVPSPADVFFDALAQFVAAYPAIADKLTGLLKSTGPDPSLQQTLTTFATLVTNVADAWLWSPALSRSDAALVEDDRIGAALSLYDYELTTLRTTTINAVVLTLIDGGSPSPTGVFPDLYWKRPAETEWRELQKGTPSGDQVIYTFEHPPATEEALQFQLVFPDMDVLSIENAISGAHLTRNEVLVTTAPTRPHFVYRTGQVAFSTLYQPFLQHAEPISFNNGSDLQNALTTLFNTLLGDAPTIYTIDVDAQFGYSLTGAPINDPASIVSYLPIAFLPATQYESTIPSRLAEAIWSWQITRPLPPGPYLYILAVTVYSSLDSTIPLLQLTELYYEGSASP